MTKTIKTRCNHFSISSTFRCLCPLSLSFTLNFNISKVAYLRGQVAGTCPTNLNQFDFLGLVAGTKFWFPRLDFR